MKNKNELSASVKRFLDSLNYGINETSKGIYFKFTGYHANGKNLKEMMPQGYKCLKVMQVWDQLAYTTINVMLLEQK